MANIKNTYVSEETSFGLPVTFCLKQKVFRKDNRADRLVAWALGMRTPIGVTIVFIYVMEKYRGKGYGERLVEGIKKTADSVITDYKASTRGGRRICINAGLRRVRHDGGEYLVWNKKKIDLDNIEKREEIIDEDSCAAGAREVSEVQCEVDNGPSS